MSLCVYVTVKLCKCICLHVHGMYVCMYVCCVGVHVRECVSVWECVCMCEDVYIISMYKSVYNVHVYVYSYICMYVCARVCMHVWRACVGTCMSVLCMCVNFPSLSMCGCVLQRLQTRSCDPNSVTGDSDCARVDSIHWRFEDQLTEIHTVSCSEDQMTTRIQNLVISCEYLFIGLFQFQHFILLFHASVYIILHYSVHASNYYYIMML